MPKNVAAENLKVECPVDPWARAVPKYVAAGHPKSDFPAYSSASWLRNRQEIRV